MKKITLLIVSIIIYCFYSMAQAPQAFKYQAVARDASGEVIADQQVSFQFSILEGSASGTVVYIEQHTDTTNQFGLVNLEIGNGSVLTGDFALIDWGNNNYFLKVELNGVHIGTSKLLSVPYAQHAKTAKSASSYTETDPVFGSSIPGGITATDTTNWNNKLDVEVDGSVTNEIQTISRTETTVTLSNGGGAFTDSVNTQTLSAVLAVNNDGGASQIKNLANPTNDQDAATKAYVDELKDLVLKFQAEIGITDIDGNQYKAVKIGNQIWMTENLRSTKYNDGTDIPLLTDNTEWSNLTTPGYCWYNNDEASNKNTYGALYNWYTVNTGKLCPIYWHVPTNYEWITLTNYLGGLSVAGGKLKETGTTHWDSPNTGATNESGFTALPGGSRGNNGTFNGIVSSGNWWSSTEYDASSAWHRGMSTYSSDVSKFDIGKKCGISVRCIKDE